MTIEITAEKLIALFAGAGLDISSASDRDLFANALTDASEAGLKQAAAQVVSQKKKTSGKVTTGIEDLEAAWSNVQARELSSVSRTAAPSQKKSTTASKPSTASEDFDLVFQAVQRNGHK